MEPTRGARAQEAARLIAQFLGDLCVVALPSEDRRSFGPFAVESRNDAITALMRQAVEGADRKRAAWPPAGIVNPAMDAYLGRFGMSAMAFVAMRGRAGAAGVIGIGRGPGRPAYTRDEIEATQRIADAIADDMDGEPGTLLPFVVAGALGTGEVERRFATLVERRDGSVVWVRDESARATDEHGRLLVEGILTDITERKAYEDRLQHLADHDGLTDLLNRRRFIDELELEIAATRRGMRSSAVLVIDIDAFKYVNDSLGHQAGDELIRAVARTLQGRLREQPFRAGEETVPVTASAGITELVPDQETLDLLSALRVDLAHGFHVGRPRPLEEL